VAGKGERRNNSREILAKKQKIGKRKERFVGFFAPLRMTGKKE